VHFNINIKSDQLPNMQNISDYEVAAESKMRPVRNWLASFTTSMYVVYDMISCTASKVQYDSIMSHFENMTMPNQVRDLIHSIELANPVIYL
jgi:hypothetical protein